MNNEEMLARMVAFQVIDKSLSPQAKELHRRMSRKSRYDQGTLTQFYPIPRGADPAALEEVKQLIDVATDPGIKIMLEHEDTATSIKMPRDPEIFSRLNSSKLRRALHDFNREAGPLPEGTIKLLYPKRKNAPPGF